MAENQQLKDRTAIVTGASSGIGRAIALRLGEAGAHVFLGGRTESSLAEGVTTIKKAGGSATAVPFDARDIGQVQGLVEKAVKATGRLDIMVNNAGLEFPSSIIEGDPERWREMFEVNVLALLVGSQAAIRAMRACGASGHVVNISSVAGRREESGVYGSTKWAVNARLFSASRNRRDIHDETVRGIVSSLGIKADIQPGAQLPPAVLDQIAAAGKLVLASADDVARAVLFAVTQPIELNIFEMVVRPQRQLQLPA